MTTLLIDETRAQDIFAGLCQAHTKLRAHIEQTGIRSSQAQGYFAADEELSAVLGELEAMLDSAAKTEMNPAEACTVIPLRYETKRVGRPAQSLQEKLDRIAELNRQIQEAGDYRIKLALGKTKRRIQRSIVTAPALAAQLSRGPIEDD